jgi:hypothetical protein
VVLRSTRRQSLPGRLATKIWIAGNWQLCHIKYAQGLPRITLPATCARQASSSILLTLVFRPSAAQIQVQPHYTTMFASRLPTQNLRCAPGAGLFFWKAPLLQTLERQPEPHPHPQAHESHQNTIAHTREAPAAVVGLLAGVSEKIVLR